MKSRGGTEIQTVETRKGHMYCSCRFAKNTLLICYCIGHEQMMMMMIMMIISSQ
jgi:hypothetical protein